MIIELIVVNMIVNHVHLFRKCYTKKNHDLIKYIFLYRGVKPIEKKDGEGAHNWGNPTENPEEHPISEYYKKIFIFRNKLFILI